MSRDRHNRTEKAPGVPANPKAGSRLRPVSPAVVTLKDVRPGGFAAACARAGESVPVLVRAAITSDEREFHQYMKGICGAVNKRAEEAGILISFDSLPGFLLVAHSDGSADFYLSVGVSLEILAKRSFHAGEVVYGKDIADVRRMRYLDVSLEPSDKVFACFKVGWKFGMFFDLAEGRELDIDAMELDLGSLHRRLRYEALYEALEDAATVDRMTKAGWFPFIETIGGDFDQLLEAYQLDFDVAAKEQKLVEAFDDGRIDRIAERWWKKPVIVRHRRVLEAGLEAFKRKDSVSCIKNIMTEIEGVLADLHLAEKGSTAKTERLLRHAVDKGIKKAGGEASLFFPRYFLEYLLKVAYANFDPNAPASAGASRHTVGHGYADGATYTQDRALQVILTLDQIAFYL